MNKELFKDSKKISEESDMILEIRAVKKYDNSYIPERAAALLRMNRKDKPWRIGEDL